MSWQQCRDIEYKALIPQEATTPRGWETQGEGGYKNRIPMKWITTKIHPCPSIPAGIWVNTFKITLGYPSGMFRNVAIWRTMLIGTLAE